MKKDTIFKIIKLEKKKQQKTLNLIASENYVNKNILKAQGSILTNKYAEGYYKKRYYGGCKYIDKIEYIAIKRAKKLFKAKYVNVQPHSGTQANLAAYNSILNIGDTILSMKTTHGGHISHGSKSSISNKIYKCKYYYLNKKGNIDYKNIKKLAIKYKPKLIIAGFSSFSKICNWKKFRKIANLNKSYLLADISHIAGLIVSNLYPNPIKYAHIVTSTTHKTLCGPRGGIILSNNKTIYKKINYSVFPQTQGGPLMHIISAKAICFKEALNKKFKKYQKQILKNTKYMFKEFKKRKFKIISNNTQTHLFVVNLNNIKISGKTAEKILEKANIIVNRNYIPDDKKNSLKTSGIRIGTPSITKRGIKEKTSSYIAKLICKLLHNIKKKKYIYKIKKKVNKICKKYPIYKN